MERKLIVTVSDSTSRYYSRHCRITPRVSSRLYNTHNLTGLRGCRAESSPEECCRRLYRTATRVEQNTDSQVSVDSQRHGPSPFEVSKKRPRNIKKHCRLRLIGLGLPGHGRARRPSARRQALPHLLSLSEWVTAIISYANRCLNLLLDLLRL